MAFTMVYLPPALTSSHLLWLLSPWFPATLAFFQTLTPTLFPPGLACALVSAYNFFTHLCHNPVNHGWSPCPHQLPWPLDQIRCPHCMLLSTLPRPSLIYDFVSISVMTLFIFISPTRLQLPWSQGSPAISIEYIYSNSKQILNIKNCVFVFLAQILALVGTQYTFVN